MTPKELYEKYAGRKAKSNGRTGVICGYDTEPIDSPLIMAVNEDSYLTGWACIDDSDVVVTHQNNACGYHYVSEKEITPES